MKKEFVPYEQALELKELGFDERCFYIWKYNGLINLIEENKKKCSEYSKWATSEHLDKYILSSWHSGDLTNLFTEDDQCLAPLWQQVFDWFRYVMLLDNFITPYWFMDGEYKVKKYTQSIEPSNRFDEYFDCDSDEYDTYEEACLKCLEKLIEIAKEQNVKYI